METITTHNNTTIFIDTIECIDEDIEAIYEEEPVEWFRLGKWTIFNPFISQQVLKGFEISFKTISGKWYYLKYDTKEAAEIILKAIKESRKNSSIPHIKENKCTRTDGFEKDCHAYNGGLCMNAVTCKGRYELHNRTTET